MNLRKAAQAGGLAILLALAVQGAALAEPGNVFVQGPFLGILADSGDSNDIRVTDSGAWYVVRDLNNSLTPGAGCQLEAPTLR